MFSPTFAGSTVISSSAGPIVVFVENGPDAASIGGA